MEFANTIQTWFKQHSGGSLMLPDGWYGRPYDNQHSLTDLMENKGMVVIILSKKLKLRFEGLKSVTSDGKELIFDSFDKLYFDWESFGADQNHGSKEYEEGRVKIIVPPG